MNPTTKVFLIVGGLALAVTLRYGFIAATASSSPRKGEARLIASVLFSSWLCGLPLSEFIYGHSLPVSQFKGKIESVTVRNSSTKRYSAYLHIHTTSGGDIDVNISDRSTFFRPGQDLAVVYRGDTGELIKATFYGPDGRQEGIAQSTAIIRQIVLFAAGLFCIWASVRKYRRDPEGAEG